MEEDEDGYFSGDQIPVFVCELLLRHRLPRNVSGLLSLWWKFKGERMSEGTGWETWVRRRRRRRMSEGVTVQFDYSGDKAAFPGIRNAFPHPQAFL